MPTVYSSETDQSVNGSAPDAEDLDEQYDFSTLFDAPSYSEFIKTAPNSKARSYERRVQSMMKAGMIMSVNAHNWPDAATFLKHGPGFAKAAGNLAAVDAKAAAIVDMMTAPDSPYLMFAMVALPMISQLARNHQGQIAEVAQTRKQRRAERKQEKLAGIQKETAPPITVRLGKRRINVPIRLRIRLPLKKIFSGFLAPTQDPREITAEVFSDEAVVKALHKMGLFPREARDEES
jgi:hypothetical protein